MCVRWGLSRTATSFHDHFDELKLDSLVVESRAPLDGQTPAALELGKETGVLIVAMRRGDMTFTRGLGHVEMQANDILYVLGEGESLNQIEEWVRTPEPDDLTAMPSTQP